MRISLPDVPQPRCIWYVAQALWYTLFPSPRRAKVAVSPQRLATYPSYVSITCHTRASQCRTYNEQYLSRYDPITNPIGSNIKSSFFLNFKIFRRKTTHITFVYARTRPSPYIRAREDLAASKRYLDIPQSRRIRLYESTARSQCSTAVRDPESARTRLGRVEAEERDPREERTRSEGGVPKPEANGPWRP